jgi:hypothetical protein
VPILGVDVVVADGGSGDEDDVHRRRYVLIPN